MTAEEFAKKIEQMKSKMPKDEDFAYVFLMTNIVANNKEEYYISSNIKPENLQAYVDKTMQSVIKKHAIDR